MVRNPARRTALVDAAIEVLARDGARGLTFRAVDVEAGVPGGTASNYFASRDDLLTQTGLRIHVRFAPPDAELAEAARAPQSRARMVENVRALMRRISADRTGYLALLELRLEATRRPELRAALTETVRANLELDIQRHRDSRAPGDRTTVLALYLAMSGLIVEHFTLPGVLAPATPDELIAELVPRMLPSR